MKEKVSPERVLRVIISDSRDPKLNLLNEMTIFLGVENENHPDTLFLWVNGECLVAGQIRSAKYGWYNEDLAYRMKVPVYKRITGGGVVYQDEGNLNWSLFMRTDGGFKSPEKIFNQSSKFLIQALKQLGFEAYFAPPNRIEVKGKKVSGMAAKSGLKCLLVHGTLLINSNLERLRMLCIPPPGCPEVANLKEWLPEITFEQVIGSLISVMQKEGFSLIMQNGSDIV